MQFSSFYIGVLFTLFLYHLIIFMGRKTDKSNLWYSLLCLFIAVNHLIRTFYPKYQNYNEILLTLCTVWFFTFIGICANLFAFSIFDLKKAAIVSKLHYILTPIIGSIFSLLYLFTLKQIFIKLYYSFAVLGPVTLTILLIKLVVLKKNFRSREEKIIFSAFSVFIIFGVLSLVFNTTIPFIYGCLITVLLAFEFSFSLAKIFNTEHKDLINLKINLVKEIEQRTDDLVKTNEKLKILNESKDILIANISHELRTPLTLIQTPVEAIINEKFGKKIDNKHKLFNLILGNTDKLIHLISNLLDLSKKGIISLFKQKINIVEIIKSYVAELNLTFAVKNINLTFQTTENSIILDIDKHLFETVISNLLSNAFKFTPKNGTISITCNTDKVFTLSVFNSGIGIPPKEQLHVFDRYYQGTQTTSTLGKGTGIGLALIKEIIEQHNGTIDLKSEQSQGATFIITLPYKQKKSNLNQDMAAVNLITNDKNIIYSKKAIPNDNSNEYSNRRKSILLVDDNYQTQSFLYNLLHDKYNIYCMDNGRKALELLENIPKPHLIISDIMMPVMDGKEFHKILSLSSRYKNIPFLFLTALVNQKEKENSLKQGVLDYIYKPFSVKELEAKIQNLLNWDKNVKNFICDNMLRNLDDISYEDTDNNQLKKTARRRFLEDNHISEREIQIIEYIVQGLQNKEIAAKFNIALSTVTNHMHNVYIKLNVNSRTELMAKFSKVY